MFPTKDFRPLDEPADRAGPLDVWRRLESVVDLRWWQVAGLIAFSTASGLIEATLMVLIVQAALGVAGDGIAPIDLPIIPLDDATVPSLLIAAAVLALTSLALQIAVEYTIAKAATGAAAAVRKQTYADFSATSWDVQSKEHDSTFMAFMQMHAAQIASAVQQLAAGTAAAGTLAALTAGALIVSPVGAIGIVAIGLFTYTVFRPVSALTRRYSKETSARAVEYASLATEAVDASLEVRTLHVEDGVRNRLATAVDDFHRPQLKNLVLARLVPRLQQRAVVGLLLGCLTGVYLAQSFVEINTAEVGAATLILLRSVQQTQRLQASRQGLASSVPYIDELAAKRAAYVDAADTYGTRQLEEIRAIELERVSFSYGTGLALHDVTVRLERGQVVGIIGPSGAGKSTFAELVVRLRRPTGGSVLVNDIPADEFDRDSWHRSVTFVPQQVRLIQGTAAENISFFRDVDRTAIEAAARLAGIHAEIEAMDGGYDAPVAARGSGGISGGQAQRLVVARALATEPGLVVFDEPTSALDFRAETAIVDVLGELRDRAVIAVIAHRMTTLRSCDRILVLDDGRVEAFGSHDEVLQTSSFYRAALEHNRLD